MNTSRDNTVVVGMSGGVDSSVAAALLREQGFNVIGVTMKTYEFDEVGGNAENEASCCGLGAINDARLVAATLGIPHYVVDMREAFGKEVIANFVEEYLNGRTPNPCVICNREIKWGELLRKADALGAAWIATGHYARTWFDKGRGRFVIGRGKYDLKDQSYALWAVSQDALRRTKFPLGELTKPQVRDVAAHLGLRTATKQESYEICFVPDNKYDRFLREQVPNLESRVAGGDLVFNNEVVGKHDGYPFYTIGQRRRLGAHGTKMYVTSIDSEANIVRIGPESDLVHMGLRARSLNWVSVPSLPDSMRVQAMVRYKDHPASATAMVDADGSLRVEFDEPKRAITPGQSAVLYDGELLVGGGVIDTVVV